MSNSFIPPPENARVKTVRSFAELVSTPFADGVNALCWPRALEGDFAEIMAKLIERHGAFEEITSLDEEDLLALELSAAGRAARAVLIEDQRLLREHGLAPSLDVIPAYPRDEAAGPVPTTDVYSWHADSATVPAGTYLCSYTVSSSEGVAKKEAVCCVDVPETRAELLKLYGGADDAGFRVFLNENFFDLHYVEKPGAKVYSFGLGNLWRIATDHVGSPVPPCVHRAPATRPGDVPRLLLIS
jgi:hypothetical protein